jgi:hypothetical protein
LTAGAGRANMVATAAVLRIAGEVSTVTGAIDKSCVAGARAAHAGRISATSEPASAAIAGVIGGIHADAQAIQETHIAVDAAHPCSARGSAVR